MKGSTGLVRLRAGLTLSTVLGRLKFNSLIMTVGKKSEDGGTDARLDTFLPRWKDEKEPGSWTTPQLLHQKYEYFRNSNL